MVKWMWILVVSLFGVALAAEAESAAPGGGAGWAAQAWAFVNSPVGLALVGGVLVWLLGKVFTAKPAWKQLVLRYGPQLMSAVKQAEKAIPDGSENTGLRRLDAALKLVVALEPRLKGAATADVEAALTAVHTAAESNGNL